MKRFLCILFLVFAFSGIAQSNDTILSHFRIQSDSLNNKLGADKSKVTFVLNKANFEKTFPIQLSFGQDNFVWEDIKSDENGVFSLIVTPGKHKFNFEITRLSGNCFYRVSVPEMEIPNQHELTISLWFDKIVYQPVEVCKPVIYVYTELERGFDLSVTPVGEFTFAYPEMDHSWKGIASPDGNIVIDGKTYPYLFWESNQKYLFQSEGNGYKVEKTEIISFLQKKLTELGLNQREQTDFITYWGPKLAANETSFVQFSVDESCDQFATMNCTPKPEMVRRVYIQIAEWDPYFENYLKDVSFSSIPTSGWYILEWGGFSFELQNVVLKD